MNQHKIAPLQHLHNRHQATLATLLVSSLGVVYGDIGTSPLYAFKECFSPLYGIIPTEANILGILSIIFWTLMLVVSVKYMSFILMADNRGEGGILSLMALATLGKYKSDFFSRILFIPIGLLGGALLFGDGVITPAISVLSAIEGLNVATPIFEPYVIIITIIVLTILFFPQKYGTGKIGFVFGPAIFIWFITIAVIGASALVKNPYILWAINPYYAFRFFSDNGFHGFTVLGAVVLVITGGEALYADMGHFGRKPIRINWYTIVLPSLLLNYFGQGALLLQHPDALENPFFHLVHKDLIYPLVGISTLATVIASQALISGIFSVARQAVQLGYFPRIKIIHTSSKEIGQIYVPLFNWLLFFGVVYLVLNFKSSSNLTAAYGVAVTGTMTITTILAFVVTRRLWKWSLGASLGFLLFFLFFDLVYFGTCLLKIHEGGWIPLVIGASLYILMITWKSGRKELYEELKKRSMPLDDFLKKIGETPPLRVSGAAIYMTGDATGVPAPMLHNLKHNKVLHETVAILTILTREVPEVDPKDRIRLETCSQNFYRIYAYYGFMETPKLKEILRISAEKGLSFDISSTTFVLGREIIVPSQKNKFQFFQNNIFALMSRNAQRPSAFFDIPVNQIIEVGIQVEM